MEPISAADKIVDTGIKALTFLTWPRILKLIALLLIVGVTGVAYINSAKVAERAGLLLGRIGLDRIPQTLSATTKQNIKFMVDKSPAIVAAQLVNLDFKKNEKNPVYFYSDISAFDNDMQSYEQNKISHSALFTDEVGNNERIVSIIQGKFVCIKLPERIKTAVPISGKVATAICSISVPPYEGHIVGYANIWIDHMPAESEYAEFRAAVRTMAVDVYERDVNPYDRS